MKRLFWLGVGLAVGAIVVRQVTKAANSYTPAGLASSARNSAAGLWESVQDFVADVREGMAEREAQIREAFAEGGVLADLDFDDDQYGDESGDAYRTGFGGGPAEEDRFGPDHGAPPPYGQNSGARRGA